MNRWNLSNRILPRTRPSTEDPEQSNTYTPQPSTLEPRPSNPTYNLEPLTLRNILFLLAYLLLQLDRDTTETCMVGSDTFMRELFIWFRARDIWLHFSIDWAILKWLLRGRRADWRVACVQERSSACVYRGQVFQERHWLSELIAYSKVGR